MAGLGKLIAFIFVILAVVFGFIFFFGVSQALDQYRAGVHTDGERLAMGLMWIGLPILVGILLIFGAVWIFVRRFTRGINRDLIPRLTARVGNTGQAVGTGLPGNGLVTALRDTGITLNHLTAIMQVSLRVTIEGRVPYDVATRVPVGRHQLGILQPGVTVPVWVDPSDPNRLAVDLSKGGQAGGGAGGRAGTVHTPGGAFEVAGLPNDAVAEEVLSGDDVLARGIPGQAEIRAATLTGATAQQMVPDQKLKPGEHDDDMVHLVLMVTPSEGAPFQTQVIVRVPDGMMPSLTIGRNVPVACLPDRQTAVVDWKALRYQRA